MTAANKKSVIHKTPTILQMETTECGAAALAIILAYYGHYISLAEVRTECGVSRDGSKAVNMLKAARRYGLNAQAARTDDWQAVFEVNLPCIVFWQFNHFIIVEGFKNNKIYINDPALGPRVISPEEFNHGFTGIILLFEPTTDFKKSGEPFSLINVIKNRLKNYKASLSYIFITSLALVIPGILIPGFSKIFIDNILIQHIQSWFVPLILGILITAFLRGIFTWLQQTHLLRLETNLYLTSSLQFIWHILHLPYVFFTQRYLGDINERVFSNQRIAQLLANGTSSGIFNLFMIVFYAIVMLLLNWPLALIGIVVAIINSGLLIYSTEKLKNLSYHYLQERGKLFGLQMNGLQIIESLKVSGAEDAFFQRWAGYHARTINCQQKISLYGILLQILPQFFTALTSLILLGFGSWLAIKGQLTLGTLVALQSLLVSFNAPLLTLLNLGSQLPEIRGDVARLEDVLHYQEDSRFTREANETIDIKQLPPLLLNVNNVQYGYSPVDEPTLKDISFDVKTGEHIAIVGITGSGKSTLAKLLATLYEPWSGEIIFAGKSIYSIKPQNLAYTLGWVDQDIFLLEGTVRENLSLWNPQVSNNNLVTALQDACIFEEIQLRGGLEAKILEGGTNLSGGEKQRLEIARALVHNPAFLILDEATNSLDRITETQIYQNLKRRQCTLLIIAHRLDVIKDCDQILVLDEGKIVQRGKHAELIMQEGLYKRLYHSNDEFTAE